MGQERVIPFLKEKEDLKSTLKKAALGFQCIREKLEGVFIGGPEFLEESRRELSTPKDELVETSNQYLE